MSLAQSSVPGSRTSSAATSTTIPDLVKIGTIPTNTAIDVETSILEPVSFSQSQCHFVLANKGILHSNSRITFSTEGDFGVLTAGASPGYATFPPGVGVHSLISRCRLAVGGKTVSEIEDFAHWMGYESTFISNETNKEREQVLNSRVINLSPNLSERGEAAGQDYDGAGVGAGNLESVTEALTVGLDNGTDFQYSDSLFLFNNQLRLPLKDEVIKATRDAHDFQKDVNKPIFSILLADLFPFLKMNQLPLFMMKEQVSVTLTFTPKSAPGTGAAAGQVNSSRLVPLGTVTAADVVSDVDIDRTNVKMIADYIYYPQDLMAQYAAANSTMGFTYVDYQFVKRTVSAADFTGQLIQNLGGAGRIVNKVVIQTSRDLAGSGARPQTLSLLGPFESDGPAVSTTTAGSVTTNLRYNDLFLYPIDVSNAARHFHNVMTAEGRMPMVSRDLYSGQGQLTTGAAEPTFMRYSGDSSIRSKFFYTAYRLNRNERVNSRGVELYDQRTTMGATTTLRAWLQVVRQAQLKDGIMEVSYA